MNEIQKQIQAVADSHGIPFEDAVKSTCESLQKAHGDPDVIFRWTGTEFRAMRKIEDTVLMGIINNALMERVAQWTELTAQPM